MLDLKVKSKGFSTLFKISKRSILRNKRRSIFCMLAIFIAVIFIIGLMSYVEGMSEGIKKAVFTFESGHIQIFSKEYDQKKDFFPLQYPINTDISYKLKDYEGIKAFLPRISAAATLTNSLVKHAVLWGIDIEQELKHNPFNLGKKNDGLLIGRYPLADSNECAIGYKMALKMEIVPLRMEKKEFDWYLSILSNKMDQTVLKKNYQFDDKKNRYFLSKDLLIKKDNYLKLLKIVINSDKNVSVPQVIGRSAGIISTIFNNAVYKDFILDTYNYDRNLELLTLKPDLDQTIKDQLLKIFFEAVTIKIPLKIVSSTYSDKYFTPIITGIFDFNYSRFDKSYIVVSFEKLQKIATLKNKTQKIHILLNNIETVDLIKNNIVQNLNNPDLLIKTWKEYPFIVLFDQMKISYLIIYIVLIIMASFLIINTIIMNINERVKEIGILSGLGLKRLEIILVFFLEALLLSVIGSFAAVILGGIATGILSFFPINMESMSGSLEFQISNTLYMKFSFLILLFSFLFGVIISSLCAIFPSSKSAFIEPVEAMRK